MKDKYMDAIIDRLIVKCAERLAEEQTEKNMNSE